MAFRSLLSRLFLLCGLLAGCGGSAQTVTIRTDGMRFVADEARVRAGEPVTLRVVNRDDYAHAFDIDEFDIHRPWRPKRLRRLPSRRSRRGPIVSTADRPVTRRLDGGRAGGGAVNGVFKIGPVGAK